MTIRNRLAGQDQICPRNFLQMADSDIIVSLHLVIPFIPMVIPDVNCCYCNCSICHLRISSIFTCGDGSAHFKNVSNGREINHKQIARWQHLSRLKASVFLFEFFVRC
jgi:hypothetical protein